MLLGLSFVSVTFPIESAQESTFLRQDVDVVKWHMVTYVVHQESNDTECVAPQLAML